MIPVEPDEILDDSEDGYDGHELPPGVTFEESDTQRYTPVDGCSLCQRERLTTWYYDIGDWWVADCVTCSVPMVVYIHHTIKVPVAHLGYIYKVLRENVLFPTKPVMANYDYTRRSIPDHYHFHIRNL